MTARPIRVAHVISNLEIGGAETALERLIAGLDPTRFCTAVWSLRNIGRIGQRMRERGVCVQNVNMHGAISAATGLYKLVKGMRKFSPDIIQGWMYHGNLAASAVRYCMPHRVPLAWNVRASLEGAEVAGRLTRRIVYFSGRVARFSEVIVNNSWHSMRAHESIGYPRRSGVIVPNGFDVELFKPSEPDRQSLRDQLKLKHDDVLIGVVGRYVPVKAHAVFVAAFAQAARHVPHLHAALVGPGLDGRNRELTQQIAAAGLQSRIHMLGAAAAMANIYPAFDVLCLPSLSEGFPNVVGEAMSCGVPCIVTNVGDCAMLVDDTGEVVQPNDVDGLSRVLQRWSLESKDVLRVRGNAARQRIAAKFSMTQVIQTYRQLYVDLTAGIVPARSMHEVAHD